jgi:outer membrane receptor for ferrienterochelin and colicin
MKVINKLLFFLVFTFSLPPISAQQDTTDRADDFEYLFKFRKKQGDTSNKIKEDTISLADFYDMSLEELENLKATGVSSELEKFINSLISVSTQKSLPSRYSPNIVTLVTEQEIQTSGARDLIDVLRLVPGFHFAQDIRGNVGLGIRGNWAAEGKVLIMLDGKEINEHYTAHTYFGNHFPVDMIKRIEIVRGPGSANHGGFAEFGVINIVTRDPEDFSGVSVGYNHGIMRSDAHRNKFNLYIGQKWKKTDLSVFFAGGTAQRSSLSHYGFYDCTVDSMACIDSLGVGSYSSLAGDSDIDNSMLNIAFNWGDFSISNLTDLYRVTDVTTLDSRNKRPLKYGYFGNYTELLYKFRITPNLTITPRLNLNVQTPWEENTPYFEALENDPEGADSLAIGVTRVRARLDINYDISHRVNLIGGIDHFTDAAFNADTVSQLYAGDPPEEYSSTAIYSEAIFKLPIFHLFAGARFETNSSYKAAFSPRIGITRKFNKFHMKFLFTDAYRLPTLGNIYYSFDGTYQIAPDSSSIYNLGRGLKPEKTFVIEAEAGYQFSENTYLTLNLFDMTIRDPIVYYYYQDENVRNIYGYTSGIYVYQNFKRAGTRGLELDFRFQSNWGYLNANYSFYSVENKPRIKAYSVSTFNRDPSLREEVESGALLAFPQHKLNISWLYYITKDFSVNVSSSFIGKRYGYDVDITGPGPFDVDGKLVKKRLTNLTNFFFQYKNLFTPGLTAGVGVFDVFNQQYNFLQPYFGLQPPLPGPSREFYFKASYQVPFKKKSNK